jgi:uncharacterized protein YndB with AHSA1/START domain
VGHGSSGGRPLQDDARNTLAQVTERGFLVCADITGYTGYLNESELEHASGVLSDLLTVLVGEVQAPLRLSRLEGDAVISYAPRLDDVSPQVLVDRLESTYVAFRRALDQIVANTTCRCNACANLPALDLKFVAHHGEFVVQRIGTQDELVGAEVNRLFRLTKNRIKEALGIGGYLALTEAAAVAFHLPGYLADLVAHDEEDGPGGMVRLLVKDMGPVWERSRSQGTVDLLADGILFTMERLLPVPLEVAWDYLTRPDTRAVMFGSASDAVEALDDGRIGTDAVYVCWHGEQRDRHVVVDWDPPHRYAFSAPIEGGLTVVGEFLLEPDGEGTTVTFRSTNPKGAPVTDEVLDMARQGLIEFFTGAFDRIVDRIAADRR